MYDFRQKRRPKVVSSRSKVSAKRVVLRPAARRHHPKVKPQPLLTTVLKAGGTFVLGIVLVALCTYLFVTKIATNIWPLTTAQTLVLVPPITQVQALPWVQVVVLDPVTQTAQVAELPGELSLNSSGKLAVANLPTEQSSIAALELGRVVDYVIPLSTSVPVRTHSEARKVFQQLLNQDTPTISTSDKIKLWLFALNLSDTDFAIKNITSLSSWQAWLASVTQQPQVTCSLALINTTPTTGLSRFMSQVMEQSGYQVVKVDSQPKFLEKSQVFINPERLQCLKAAEQLIQFLPETVAVVSDQSVTQQARADIVWLLGNDIAGPAAQVID